LSTPSSRSVIADTIRSPDPASETVTLPPTSIGRFEVLQQLGEGAFGTVYRARDPQLDRDVAIKVPRSGASMSRDERDRFLREARAAAGLHHPSICAVHEAGSTEDGRDFLVMAYIEGRPLSKVLQERPMSDEDIVKTVRAIALALAEAHASGVIHRDLKPANIMINARGEPVVMDFGLARRQSSSDPQLSVHGQIMGTPAYMSPEQARGDSTAIGPATDIYSLGVVMYEMLCGQRPFSGTATEVIGQILHIPPPLPSQFRGGIDSRLQSICMTAIAKNPAERYRSMSDVADALANALLIEPASDTAAPPPRTSRGRVVAGGLLSLIALLGITFFVRTPQMKVSVVLDVDVRDPQFKFHLDGVNYTGETLAGDIELTPGPHRLLVLKNNQVYRDYELTVIKGKKSAEIRTIARAPDPAVATSPNMPANPSETKPPELQQQPTPVEQGWIELFNGQDLSNWESDTDASSFHVDEADKTLVVTSIAPNSKLRRHWLFTREDYSDYVLRFDFLCETERVKSAMAIKGKLGSDPQYNIELAIQVRDDRPAPGLATPARPTGSLVINGVDGVTPTDPPSQKPRGEWNQMEIKLQRQVVSVVLNDRLVHAVDLTDIDRSALPAEAIENLDRNAGRIGIQSMEGTIRYRNIRLKNLAPPAASDTYRKAFGKHSYRFMKEHRTWPEAIQRCERLSGRLAVVDSAEKQAFLMQLLADGGGQQAWISARRDDKSGTWMTQQGQPITFSDWPLGEPRRTMTQGLVVSTTAGPAVTGRWNSAADDDRAGFFIEWDLPNGTEPTNLAATADRRAAEHILSIGGSIRINGPGGSVIEKKHALPDAPFELTSVYLQFNKQVTDKDLECLRPCQRLKEIILDRTKIGDEGLMHLQNCRQLQQIVLVDTKVTDRGMEVFRGWTTLTHVWLMGLPVTNDGLSCLSACDKLEHLDISATKVTDRGLEFLTGCPHLTNFGASWTGITDAGLAHLENSPDLMRLYLTDVRIGDIGIARFAKLKNLEFMELSSTSVTDDGLKPFLKSTSLKKLNVKKTRVSNSMIQQFRNDLPSCRIEF
jgi:serine/threonine protein kinase